MKFFMHYQQAGQTLIELLVGLSAAVVVISAITVAGISSLNNAQFSRDQNLATQYTQEGLEIMRNMRDLNIASINASSLPDGVYCLAKTCAGINKNISDANCGPRNGLRCSQNVNSFVREVTISHNDPFCNGNGPTPLTPTPAVDTVKVSVSTYWTDPKCTSSSNTYCHSVLFTSCLSDFTIAPTP